MIVKRKENYMKVMQRTQRQPLRCQQWQSEKILGENGKKAIRKEYASTHTHLAWSWKFILYREKEIKITKRNKAKQNKTITIVNNINTQHTHTYTVVGNIRRLIVWILQVFFFSLFKCLLQFYDSPFQFACSLSFPSLFLSLWFANIPFDLIWWPLLLL